MAVNQHSTIVYHFFKEKRISQAKALTNIAGYQIPFGYANATQMCQANGKRWGNYKQLKSTQAYWQALADDTGIPVSSLVIEIEAFGDLQGTWVHPEIAIDLSQWVSIEFRLWANRVLNGVVNGDYHGLTEEAERSLEKLQEINAQLRSATKETFWFLTASVQAYHEIHPRVERFENENYSRVLDAINLGLFGKRAQVIKKELGIKSGLNRDHFGVESLKRIDMIQRLAQAQIEHHGSEPKQAVEKSLALMNYKTIHYKD